MQSPIIHLLAEGQWQGTFSEGKLDPMIRCAEDSEYRTAERRNIRQQWPIIPNLRELMDPSSPLFDFKLLMPLRQGMLVWQHCCLAGPISYASKKQAISGEAEASTLWLKQVLHQAQWEGTTVQQSLLSHAGGLYPRRASQMSSPNLPT